MAKGPAAKKTGTKKKAAKRVLIDTGRDKRFARRGAGGKFKHRGVKLVGRYADRRLIS